MTTILIVEDEASYRETLEFSLRRDGYHTLSAANGADGIRLFQTHAVDVVLLDLMLPDISGIDVCRKIRSTSSTPIIMVTAKDETIDKIIGLEVGADDYVSKPYSYRELLARVHAVLRRTATGTPPQQGTMRSAGAVTGAASLGGSTHNRQKFGRPERYHGSDPMAPKAQLPLDNRFDEEPMVVGDIVMDTAAHVVTVRGEEISMPLKEFELLEYLMSHPGRVLTRTQLLNRVWGEDFVGDTKTLDVHIKRVRSKIEQQPSKPQALVTVRGLGYKLLDIKAESSAD